MDGSERTAVEPIEIYARGRGRTRELSVYG
jgi:hypothetical protein